MKKIGIYAAVAIISLTSSAQATIMGFSDNTTIINNGGGSWTYFFDIGGSSDIKPTSGGLSFQNGSSPTLNVTGSGAVNQIFSGGGNAGLGVTGGDTGDDLSTGEWLQFSLGGGMSFNLDSIIFNNGCDGTEHQDRFSTTTGTEQCSAMVAGPPHTITVTGSNGKVESTGLPGLDTINDTNWKDGLIDNSPSFYSSLGFVDLTNFRVEEFNEPRFSGYVEAIRITLVPEPSIIALFSLGLFGIGVARRRQS